MREIPSEELKQIELDILKDVADFCDAHGLRYFLAFGTLLGAVRHKGFIPWDDDIDIFMPYEDYQLFIKNYTHPYYYVNSIEKDNSFYLLFAKVYDDRTYCLEGNRPSHAWIDVFPLIGLPERKFWKKFHINSLLLLRSIWKHITIVSKENISDQVNFAKKYRVARAKTIKKIIPSNVLVRIISCCFSARNFTGSSECMCLGLFVNSIFISRYFIHSTKIEFEHSFFTIPTSYDELLRSMYGDYMTPPPEGQRITHNIKAYWKD